MASPMPAYSEVASVVETGVGAPAPEEAAVVSPPRRGATNQPRATPWEASIKGSVDYATRTGVISQQIRPSVQPQQGHRLRTSFTERWAVRRRRLSPAGVQGVPPGFCEPVITALQTCR